MTSRGIRRKKSYLVDAKIAVCGQKSVGKSGKSSFALSSALDEMKNKQLRASKRRPLQ